MNPTTPDDPLIGQLFADRYRIERKLGAGGMGAVYVARQVAMDRLVALKVLSPQLAGTDQASRRFHREMQATARVEHQNTIRVHDFGESGGRLFLAMELLDGRTLTAAMREAGPMPLERVVHLGVQMAKALGAAHHEGVIHRDLKPDNVMLLDRYGERDFVKVLDFGIARVVDAREGETQLTEAGSLVGTPVYMSPEQSMGAAVDARSDLYALGVVLYQMATGTVPFQDPTPLRVLFMHVQDEPKPPSQWVPGLAPELEAVILRLLQKDPALRPQTAQETAALLDACATRHPQNLQGLVHTAVTVDAAVTVDGDTLAGVPAVAPVQPEPREAVTKSEAVVAEARAEVLPKTAETQKKPWPWLAGITALAVLGSVLVWSLRPRPVAVPRSGPTVAVAAAPKDDRHGLDALYVQAGEPVPPQGCRCEQAEDVARLVAAGRALRMARDGASGPEITQAFADLQQGPACAEKDSWRARVALLQGKAAEAEAASRKALALCPDLADAHHLAGKALLLQGNPTAAEAEFRRALALAPDFTAPAFNLGLLAVARKDGTAAVALLEPLTRREADRGDVWFGYGHALALTDRRTEANAAWCKARDLGLKDAVPLCRP